MLEEQEALQDAAQGAETEDGPSQPGKRKDKRMPLDLPLKWSIKREPLSIFPYVNSVFIPCECTIIITLAQVPHSSKNAMMVT